MEPKDTLQGYIVIHPADGSAPIKLAPAQRNTVIDAMKERAASISHLRRRARQLRMGDATSKHERVVMTYLQVAALIDEIADALGSGHHLTP